MSDICYSAMNVSRDT